MNWSDPCCGCWPGRGLGHRAKQWWWCCCGRFFRAGRPDLAWGGSTLYSPPQDPGRRHLNQDGSRAGTCGAQPNPGTGSGRRAGGPANCAVSPRPAGLTLRRPGWRFPRLPVLEPFWTLCSRTSTTLVSAGLGAHVESRLEDPGRGWAQLSS